MPKYRTVEELRAAARSGIRKTKRIITKLKGRGKKARKLDAKYK